MEFGLFRSRFLRKLLLSLSCIVVIVGSGGAVVAQDQRDQRDEAPLSVLQQLLENQERLLERQEDLERRLERLMGAFDGVGTGFGELVGGWDRRTWYSAETDGLVLVNSFATTWLRVVIRDGSDDGASRIRCNTNRGANSNYTSLVCPVRSGESWAVYASGSSTVEWMPIRPVEVRE